MNPIRTATVTAALGALTLGAPATAWASGPYLQPADSPILQYAYPTRANYCPAGLQPIIVGGVICCGVPNATGYNPNPPVRHYKPKPYVAYGKGYNENTPVYEKGQ